MLPAFLWLRRGTTASRRRRPIVCEPLESRMLLSGAVLVKDIIPGPESSVAMDATHEAALGSKLIFAATDGTHGLEPWVSDGTALGTIMLRDINLPGSSSPDQFVVGNGVVYFTANDGTSTQEWKTDGTPGGTKPVTAVPSATDARMAVFNVFSGGTLFFTESGDNHANSLWATDGSAPGAERELSSFGGDQSSDALPIAAVNGRLFFDEGFLDTLWTSDGTAAGGTHMVKVINSTGAALIRHGIIFKGQCFFSAFGDAGEALWKSDGTDTGTSQVSSTVFESTLYDFTVSGGTLYFLAEKDSHGGVQIWSTDGTSVTQVTSISLTSGIRDLTDVNGTLFFDLGTGGGKTTLYKLVGGTPTQIALPSDGSATGAGFLTNVNGTVFFNALDASGNATLFASDGTSINLVTGDRGSDPMALLNVNGTLFYSAGDPATGTELHSAIPTGTSELSVDLGDTINIDEGAKSKVTFHATVIGGTGAKYAWDLKGNGKYKIGKGKTGASQSFSYTKFPVGTITVTVVVLTTDGRKVKGQVFLNIQNVAPTVKVSATVPKSHLFLRLVPILFTATWKDPGVNDDFTVQWTLTNLTLFSTTTISQFSETVGKAHKARWIQTITGPSGTYSVTAEVTDKDKGAGSDTFGIGVG